MKIKDISIKVKVIIITIIFMTFISILFTFIYINDIEKESMAALIDKSKAIVLQGEAIRKEMANKIKLGIMKDFSSLLESKDKNIITEIVPVFTAINILKINSEKSGYTFRVPKISPRNPNNTPDKLELEVLKELTTGDKIEKIIIEKDRIRYFRPIRLTEECMICHGEPAGELDPLGGIKEGWKVGEIHGAFEIISSLDNVKKIQRRAIIQISFITAVLILLLSFFIVLIINFVFKPLKEYIMKFKQAENGDISVRANVSSNDEIGILSKYFNNFMDSISNIIAKVKERINITENTSSNLFMSSEKTLSSLEEMRANIENMKKKIDYLDKEIYNSFESIKDVKKFIDGLVNLINSQSAAITESSASIEEMMASIQSIAKVSEEKKRLVIDLEDTAIKGGREMEETVEVIKKVAESANTILDMINIIKDIADKTDLLAMNAAIEAAHAGSFGKGFAVVAEEIRRLAENSTDSAKHISESLNKIREYINTSENSIINTGNIFNKIVDGVKEVSLSMQEMFHATKELSIGSSQILEAISSLIEITQKVQDSSNDISDRIDKITNFLNQLNIVSTDNKNSMIEIDIGIKEIYNASVSISKAGNENLETVKKLEESINKFKL